MIILKSIIQKGIMDKVEKDIIKDIIQLLQGIDITLRQYRGQFSETEEELNSIIEENIKAFSRLQKRQEKVTEQRKRVIEKILKGMMDLAYNFNDSTMTRVSNKIYKLLDNLE